MPYLGAHESVAGGLHFAFDHIQQVGGDALQIFTRNQRQWHPKPVSSKEQQLFASAWERQPSMVVASHASYLIKIGRAHV